MFTVNEYREAIRKLRHGMNQLRPDGHNCNICGDSGHQAWECHHNPLVALKLVRGWRCFHCNCYFLDWKAAEEHFGISEDETPKCLIERRESGRKVQC